MGPQQATEPNYWGTRTSLTLVRKCPWWVCTSHTAMLQTTQQQPLFVVSVRLLHQL